MLLLRIHPDNPAQRQILKVVEILQKGGIVIYPTDTVYAVGCSIDSSKAIDKIARLKGVKIEKANFAFLFNDLSHLSVYTKHVDTNIYKLLKKNTPGPFTFILEASNKIPKIFRNKKKTIGIRIPDNNILQDIIRESGHPLLTTSMHANDEIIDYITDPELLYDEYKNYVDAVIDGGYGGNIGSAIVDCTGDEVEVIREGVLELEL